MSIGSKENGNNRICLDFGFFTLKTLRRVSFTKCSWILNKLNGTCISPALDATTGYRQIRMTEGSKLLAAISLKRGHYEFNKMAISSCNAPETFQCLMNSIFLQEKFQFILLCFDALIIYPKNEQNTPNI